MVCEGVTVLIVDDERVVCDVLRDELSDQGFLCTTAFNGNEALTEMATRHFDVLLLDIKLPGMSGIEVLRMIQSDRRNTATIMITAVNNVDTAVEAMKLGASDYIVKPFDLDKVTRSIHASLENKKRLPETSDHKTAPCVCGNDDDEQAVERSFSQIDAIADGVEAKLDLLDGHSKRLTQRTIDVARQLGIVEEEIERWAVEKARLDSDRNRLIKSSLNKLKRSPLAQVIMGVTEIYRHVQKSGESQN